MSGPSRFTKPTRCRPDRRRRALSFEWLEARDLLSFTARQVLDLNTSEVGTRPHSFTTVGDELFFLAPGMEYLEERSDQLWKYDGTTATQLTHVPGDGVTSPPVAMGGTIYFAGDIGSENSELWRYDAATGPRIAADLIPEGANTENGSEPDGLTGWNGRLYFAATTDEYGRELWSFDGAMARLAANINQVRYPDYSGDGWSSPSELIVYAGALYFVADDGIHGPALWRFDGEAATLAADIDPRSALPSLSLHTLATFGGDLYFLAHDYNQRPTVFRFDGVQASAIGSLPWVVNRANAIEFHGHLYYAIDARAFDQRIFQIWRTDGVSIERMADLATVANLDLAVYRGELYFIGNDGYSGAELWAYDGTHAARISDINLAGDSLYTDIYVYTSVAAFRDAIYFAASDTNRQNMEIWKSDGALVQKAIDLMPGNAGSTPIDFLPTDESLYFFVSDHLERYSFYGFDGQVARQIPPAPLAPAGWFTPFYATTTDTTYFMAGSSGGLGLWRLEDGRPVLVSQTCGGGCTRMNRGIVALGNEVFFIGMNWEERGELWKFDGQRFTSLSHLPINQHSGFARLGDALYFLVKPTWDDYVIYRYDSESFGDITEMFPVQPMLGEGVDRDGRLYYPAGPGTQDIELWTTDPLTGDTRRVVDLAPGPWSSQPYNLTVVEGQLYFTAYDYPAHSFGRQLWRLEGDQPQRLTADHVSVALTGFGPLTVLDGQIFFVASTPETGHEPWVYDSEKSTLIADVALGPRGSNPFGMTVWRDAVYLAADDSIHGSELWKISRDRDADLDGDGVVGMSDAVILQRNLGIQSGASRAQGDLDGDGAVTPLDVAILAKQFGRRPAIATPAPALASATESTGAPSSRTRLTAKRTPTPVRPNPQAVDAALSATVTSFHSARTARSARVR